MSGSQIELLAESGWSTCDSIREGLKRVGLPVPTARYLEETFTGEQWMRAEQATSALRDCFKDSRFVDHALFGIILVPDPAKLDTRGALEPSIRRSQTEISGADYVDNSLPPGKVVTKPAADWTLVATITGSAGIFMGSYEDIHDDKSAEIFTVAGVDTRNLMVRQIWGARVLQSGTELPDSSARESWTFTLFPGEDLTGGRAASGTVLHGRVRFRLGRTDRGISSVRVCPALVVHGAPASEPLHGPVQWKRCRRARSEPLGGGFGLGEHRTDL